MAPYELVADRLASVGERIASAALRSGRDPDGVTLVAVSKSQPVEAIQRAYDAGHRDFGENRAQELVDKATALPDDIRWHFVGSLQRRKAKLIRSVTALLHSLDRASLAVAWSSPGVPAPPVLVQVNVGHEPQKGGVEPDAVAPLLDTAEELGLTVTGLMAIPPAPETKEESRSWFMELAQVQHDLTPRYPALVELSMGMTDDFEVAIEAGSTIIRVGRAIFGPRPNG